MTSAEVDVLVVGAGPAGLTAAALLAGYGVRAVTVTKYSGTANSPRSHHTNQRAVEILRELGVEDAVMAVAMPHQLMGTLVVATSFAGMELARYPMYGAGVDRRSEYEAASPCQTCNVPQHMLEPVLLAAARERGADIRFSTELLQIAQDDAGVTAVVRERESGAEYQIRARYVIGADGASSTVADQIGFEIEGEAGLGDAFTVWLEADLAKYTRHRSGALFTVCVPGSEVRTSTWTCVGYGPNPWTEWNPLFMTHSLKPSDLSEEAVLTTVRQAIGDPDVAVTIKKVSTWQINHQVAATYRRGRVFLAGDAAHRHPPANGLGSNTCIQDSYNLAWKLALVIRGVAGDGLLDSYGEERQPVGRQVVDRAIKSQREGRRLTDALGIAANQTAEEAWANFDELYGETETGARRRAALADAIDLMNWKHNALGVELGQRYHRSSAVLDDGTPWPAYTRDPELHYHPTTHPGAYLPHVWLAHDTDYVSTLDITGHGRFTVLTGVGGNEWVEAAGKVSAELDVDVQGLVIGMRQKYDDVQQEWAKAREIADRGAILVRPDRHIAWRTHDQVDDPTATLRGVMKALLHHGR